MEIQSTPTSAPLQQESIPASSYKPISSMPSASSSAQQHPNFVGNFPSSTNFIQTGPQNGIGPSSFTEPPPAVCSPLQPPMAGLPNFPTMANSQSSVASAAFQQQSVSTSSYKPISSMPPVSSSAVSYFSRDFPSPNTPIQTKPSTTSPAVCSPLQPPMAGLPNFPTMANSQSSVASATFQQQSISTSSYKPISSMPPVSSSSQQVSNFEGNLPSPTYSNQATPQDNIGSCSITQPLPSPLVSTLSQHPTGGLQNFSSVASASDPFQKQPITTSSYQPISSRPPMSSGTQSILTGNLPSPANPTQAAPQSSYVPSSGTKPSADVSSPLQPPMAGMPNFSSATSDSFQQKSISTASYQSISSMPPASSNSQQQPKPVTKIQANTSSPSSSIETSPPTSMEYNAHPPISSSGSNPPPVLKRSFQPPTAGLPTLPLRENIQSLQQSSSTPSFQPNSKGPNFQANVSNPNTPLQTGPTVSVGFNSQQPVPTSVTHPPPIGSGLYKPPIASFPSTGPIQTPMASTSLQPGSASNYQPPMAQVSSQQQPSSATNFQSNSFSPRNIQPGPPSVGFSAQQPVLQPSPVSGNSFRPPNEVFRPMGNPMQQPLVSRPPGPASSSYSANFPTYPPSSTNYSAHPTSYSQQPPASNILRPPVSSNSFQAPASNMPPQQFQQRPRLIYPKQNGIPPSMYNQGNKPPLSNGILPESNNYPQPNIPPLQTSQFPPQPSSYNNQVPPSYNGRPQAYPSNNIMSQPASTGYPQSLNSQFSNMSVNQGLNRMWGYEPHDLLNLRDILPTNKVEPPPIRLPQNLPDSMNCARDLFRCTLTKIPETKSILDKSRLPLGLLIHPFKDINNLKVIKNMIVRCRQCRTYINPFVQFLDCKQWKCNICFRTNEIHEQYLYDRNTEMYGDPYKRPEIQSATVEYLATSDYTVRDPPQPAMYLFLLDVSQIAAQSGYLYTVCETLLKQLKAVPGDLRTSVAIITYDSAVHFYSLAEGQTQPAQMILTDIEDIFLPSPENILVNLKECYDMIVDLVKQLPDKFKDSVDSGSALGPALQAAFKLLQPTGGRITIFQTCLPNTGPGALQSRENPNQRSNDEPQHMNPATDFYKKIALECTSFYIAVDLFILNSQYVDLSTLSGVSKFSSGCIHHIPLYNGKNLSHSTQLERMFSRYLTRKIGFESVMRIRCTKGLSIHTFHGNFFVRSTDLLALPNVNPDAGYGIQISIDESLTHVQHACFQVAVLYTSSKGDRRIRVHTLCLPVCSNVNDVLVGADQQCIAGLLAKMAVDRSLQHSLSDAREAFLNVICDVLSTYKMSQSGHQTGSLLAPSSLKLLPLYILGLLKHPAFRIGQSTRLDDRIMAMGDMKCLPLNSLLLSIYPELYPIHTLESDPTVEWNELDVPIPRILQLSAERLAVSGTYLLNLPDVIIILVRHGTSSEITSGMFGFQSVAQMPETLHELPQLETHLSLRLHSFISYLNDDKAYSSPVKVIKDSSPDRMEFYDKLIEDKNGGGMSYYEFLQRIREQVKNA